MSEKVIGVLALQGAFAEHIHMLNQVTTNNPDLKVIEIRARNDFIIPYDNGDLVGIVIPGGESTVMSKLLYDLDLFEPLKNALENGLPALGTCAGLVLLSKSINNSASATADSLSNFNTFAVLDVETIRNAYGRQLGSFTHTSTLTLPKQTIKNYNMVFIRAPYVSEIINHDKNVQILATVDNKIVAVSQDNIIATAFHPELTNNIAIHQAFVDIINDSK